MLDGLFIASLVSSCYQVIKEACTPTIPAENWANKDLYYEDMMKGVPMKQLMKNVENGKYKLTEKYPEPHRDSKTGKIVIENYELYKKDCLEFGVHQAWKWVKQGKYNLTPEEFNKEKERIQKELEYLHRL